MTSKEGLENPFGPGGAYSGGASFVARGADLRSPQATQERRLKNLEMAIYSAVQQFNSARQAIKLEPVQMRLFLPEQVS